MPAHPERGHGTKLRPEQRLLQSVEANDVLKVKEVLEDAQCAQQITRSLLSVGLIRACDKDHVHVARYLLTRGADPEFASGNKPKSLLRAAEYGLLGICEALIDHHADLEARDKKGRTPLMTAAWKGHFEIVQLLMSRGAHVDAVDLRRRNVLHNIAADRGEDRHASKTANKSGRKCGMHIVHYLLKAGVNLDAEDELGRTALHWSCVTDNEELMKILLTTRFGGASPKARVNAKDARMKSPLHLAASHNRYHLARILLDNDANVHARSDGDWTALHNACQAGSRKMVQVLLDARADVNRQLLNGRTPLHVAAEYGNVEAAECLLEQPGIQRSIKDRFGNTALLIAASKDQRRDRHGKLVQPEAVRKGKRTIVEMLAPWNHIDDLSVEEIEAAKQFSATIVDFGDFKNDNKVDRRSIYELLYARPKDKTKHCISTLPAKIKSSKFPPFRWIHLPVNNIAWCDALLTKRFIEEGAADVEGYKALEASFNHQHRGQQHHSRFMRPMCQVVHRTEDEDDIFDAPVIVEDPQRLSPILGTPIREVSHDRSGNMQGFMSPETPTIGGASSAESTRLKSRGSKKAQRQDAPDATPTLPISDTLAGTKQEGKPTVKRQESNSTVTTSGSNPQKKGAKQLKDSRKATNRQTSKNSADKPGKALHSSCNIFMFMPYLHFETDRRRREMQDAMMHPERLLVPSMAVAPDEILLRAHLTKSASFLHVRRTLDQFFYHNIDTSTRDCDQVVYRYQQKHRKEANIDPKIFMVDQLWMWVLGKDLVVTSFPQRWRQPRNDPLNVLEGIIEDINSKTREPVQDVYELAMTIAGRCFGTFDRHRKGDDDFQFLDMFESSIGAAMDNEASLFQDFSKASRQASEWLKSHQRPERLSRTLEAQAKAYEHNAKRHPDRVQDEDAYERNPQFVDKLLDVGAETDLLAEIKDIRDELDIIRMVLDHQVHLLPELREAVKGVYYIERSHARVRKVEKAFDEQEKTISNPIKDISRMETQADRVYESIRGLLDLKQKHANAFEARFARDQAAGTQRQGQTIMVFTIVTVIFLPLSFITSFFAINVEQFPHPTGLSNGAVIPLSYVCSYIFGIGLAITIPAITIALNVDDISRFAIASRDWLCTRWFKFKRKRDPAADHELEAMRIGQTLSVAKSLRRSVDVNWNGKPRSPPSRRISGDSRREGAYLRRPSRPPDLDLERGRRNARADTLN